LARPSDLLRRFRLIAVPGKAGIAGVPVDRAAMLREELAPVFATLRETDQRASDIVARAASEGDSRRAHAALDAQRILDEAYEAQPAARVSAASAVETEAKSSGAEIRMTADKEVERINVKASQTVSPLVEELVRRVMSTGLSSRTSP